MSKYYAYASPQARARFSKATYQDEGDGDKGAEGNASDQGIGAGHAAGEGGTEDVNDGGVDPRGAWSAPEAREIMETMETLATTSPLPPLA